MLKKILLVITTTILIFTLSSCRRQNLHTPTGNITGNFVSADGVNITNLELYNKLRSQHGLSVMTEEIHRFILEDYIATVNDAVAAVNSGNANGVSRNGETTNQDIYDELVEVILRSIFNTDDYDRIAALDATTFNQTLDRYRDNFFLNNGVRLTGNIIDFDRPNVTTITGVTYIANALYRHYAIDVARNLFGRAILAYEYATEYFDEDEEDRNPNYISEDDIEAQFYRMTEFGTRYAIIITFPTDHRANVLINDAIAEMGGAAELENLLDTDADDLTSSDKALIIQFFSTLHNLRYGRGTDIEANDLDTAMDQLRDHYDYFVFNHNNDDGNELLTKGSHFNNFFNDRQDFDFALSPTTLGGTRTMFLRIGEELRFEENENGDIEWEDHKDLEDLRQEIVDILLDRALSPSFINNRLNRTIDSDAFELTIFDPILEFQFSRNRENFNFNTTRNVNNRILTITYNDRLKNLYVDDFFDTLVERFASNHITEMLINRLLVNTNAFTSQLEDDTDVNLNRSFDNISRSFRNSDLRHLGLDNYLLINHGFDNRDDVINYVLKADILWTIASNDFETIEGDFLGTVRNVDNRFLEDGNTIFHFFAEFTRQAFEDQFSIGIQHILITIDYDNDGSPDDPFVFFNSLDDAARADFEATIQRLAFAILQEVDIMSGVPTTMTALEYIRDSFNRNGYIWHLNDNTTWQDEFWTPFNIGLTVEDLGTVTASSVNNFVTPFADAVRELNNYLTGEGEELLDDEEGFFQGSRILDTVDNYSGINLGFPGALTTNGNGNRFDDTLIHTVFGFHILNVTETTHANTARFQRSNDWSISDTGSLRFENIEVVLNPLDDEDDHRIGIADAYSYYDHPSAAQLFVWFFESQRSGGATSGNTSVRNVISSLFNPVIARFNDRNFQTWRLIQFFELLDEDNITFYNDAFNMANFELVNDDILQRQFFDYQDSSIDGNHAFRGWFEAYKALINPSNGA